MDILDKIIGVATKANAAIDVIAPGAGTIGALGIGLVKFIAAQVNEQRRVSGDPALELPADDVLIAKLQARADSIVNKGQAFLED